MKKTPLLLLLYCLYFIPANAQSFGVESFTLVNHNTDEDIRVMANPDTTFGGFYDYNIRANTFGNVGSVKFEYYNVQKNSSWSRIENEAPYALGGDHNGDYDSWWTIPGDYIITATPYQNNNGQGQQGLSLSINMVVIYNQYPPVIQSFTLVDPVTDTDIRQLHDNDTLYTGTPMNIRINTDKDYGTIKIQFGDSYFKTEIWPPFAVGGDETGNYFPWFPEEGTRILTATPFSESYGIDGIKGTPVSISLTVLEPSLIPRYGNTLRSSDPVLYPNPVIDELKIIFDSQKEPTTIKILDIAGHLHLEYNIEDSAIPSLNLASLNPGVYFAVIETNAGRERYKFIKK